MNVRSSRLSSRVFCRSYSKRLRAMFWTYCSVDGDDTGKLKKSSWPEQRRCALKQTRTLFESCQTGHVQSWDVKIITILSILMCRKRSSYKRPQASTPVPRIPPLSFGEKL